MGKTLLLLALALMGCTKGYEGQREIIQADVWAAYQEVVQQTQVVEEQIRISKTTHHYERVMARVDRLLSLPPSIRYYDDSLAHADSVTYAYLLMLHIGDLYYYEDTTSAVFTYMSALPWFEALELTTQAEEARRLAGTIGDAIGVTHSPNMARLSYQAFERARQLALASADSVLYHLADSSYKAVAHQVMAMPDSVRHAFGPPPERPARIPWVLATLAAAFIAVSVAGGRGWKATTSPCGL